MRKILIGFIIALLSLAIVLGLLGKINIAGWRLLGVNQIQTASLELDKKISEISALTGITYPQKMSELTAVSKNLISAKDDYKNKVQFSSEEDVQNSRKLQNYEIEFLWTHVGKYATKEGIKLKFEIQTGSTVLTKNLSFTVNGDYISITDFIYDLENDSDLGFIIENFAMVQGTDNSLTATFMVKDLYVNVSSITTQAEPNNNTTTNTNTTNTNTTNTNSTNNQTQNVNNTL